ncbi:MAG: hypothetical protein OXU79_00270 [Gemmatimonadota bacterium]|nr:hypothetical protein [Gemmatimonadota bacterium]
MAVFLLQNSPDPEHIHVLETLTRAWSERRQVRIVYHNPQTGETTRRTIDPSDAVEADRSRPHCAVSYPP